MLNRRVPSLPTGALAIAIWNRFLRPAVEPQLREAIQVPIGRRGGEEIKFIGFREYSPEDLDKVIERSLQTGATREKFLDRFPKYIFGLFAVGGEPKRFTVRETDNPDQLTNLSLLHTRIAFEVLAHTQERRA